MTQLSRSFSAVSAPQRLQPDEKAKASSERLPRGLAVELVTYLAQHQVETRSKLANAARAIERQATAAEYRAAQAGDRLDRIERQLDRLAQDTRRLREITTALRTFAHPTRHSSDLNEPIPLHAGRVESATAGKVLMRVEHLSKDIGGVDILTDINFDIYEHEILGLIGPNGAGKTTLMECLANLRPRTSGTLYEGEEAPADWNPKSLMFYLPNGMAPYAELYTIDVLKLFGKLFEVDPQLWERIIVDELNLGPVLQKKVSALSKGNLQRLLIAFALMSPQPLLALDEPFDGLDLHQTQAMMDILRDLRAQKRTLLLCIHQLQDAERICDRLLLLSGGHMVGIGTLDELRAQAGLSQGGLEDVFMSLTGRKPAPSE
jgi:ABC-2 type transport system ATP-binding protein